MSPLIRFLNGIYSFQKDETPCQQYTGNNIHLSSPNHFQDSLKGMAVYSASVVEPKFLLVFVAVV